MCEWCGHDHDQAALCTERPTWGRRGFLALFGAGIAGMAVTGLPTDPPQLHFDRVLTNISIAYMQGRADERGKALLEAYRMESIPNLWLAI